MLGMGVTVREIRRTPIRGTYLCGFSVVQHMRTRKEVARYVREGNDKPQGLRGNGRLAQLGNGKRESKTHDEYWQQGNVRCGGNKGKVRPLTSHEGGGKQVQLYSFLTSALDEVGG